MATLDALFCSPDSLVRAPRSVPLDPSAGLARAARFALAFGIMAVVAAALFAHGFCLGLAAFVETRRRRAGLASRARRARAMGLVGR